MSTSRIHSGGRTLIGVEGDTVAIKLSIAGEARMLRGVIVCEEGIETGKALRIALDEPEGHAELLIPDEQRKHLQDGAEFGCRYLLRLESEPASGENVTNDA